MPSFLYPAFLLGALAIAIPVLLHLLRHQQAQEVRFSAVRLLREVRVEHAERRRVRHWLLLALRASALVLLALAFARPYVEQDRAGGGRAATIVALDRSASMSPVWDAALEEARRVFEARPGEAVGLLAFDDRAEVLVAPTLDRADVQAALAALRPGVGGTHYGGMLALAAAALEETGARESRLVIVSDLQGGRADARGVLSEAIGLEVVSVARGLENLAILAARYESQAGQTRGEATVIATVRNDGIDERRVPVVLEANGRSVSSTPAAIAPGAVAEVSLEVPSALADRELGVRLDVEDAIGADNVRYLFCGDPAAARVTIVASAGEAFYLDGALRASVGGPEFDTAIVAPPSLGAVLGREPAPHVVVLVSARGLDRGGRDALVAFVEAGGGLLVAAGTEASDQVLGPLLPGVEIAGRPGLPTLTWGAMERRHPLFTRLAGAEDGLARARFSRAWHVRADGWRTLAWFDDGSGALHERRLGQGRIVLFASDLNRRGNDLPVQPAFVPFVQELARHLAPEAGAREVTPALVPRQLPSAAGFLDLPSGRRVAINVDPRESDTARMTVEDFAAAVRRTPAVAGGETPSRAAATESSQALWRYGLMLMLAALVVEGLVAGRPWRGTGLQTTREKAGAAPGGRTA